MDSHRPAKRRRPASARQRRQPDQTTLRQRHTQRPAGGGVSSGERPEDAAQGEGAPGASSPALRKRIQSGALTTATVMSERLRRVSKLAQQRIDPLTRSSGWIVEPTWYEHAQNWLSEAMPFRWRERARRKGFWRKRALPVVAAVACVTVALAIGIYALNTAGRAAGAFSAVPTAQATVGGSVMISPNINGISTTPTPVAEEYDVGVWVSDTLPQGGSVTVYARVSRYTQPVAHVRVYIYASTPNGGIRLGPLTTDAYGVAHAQLNYGNIGSSQPIFLTGTATINGKQFSGTYTFVTF